MPTWRRVFPYYWLQIKKHRAAFFLTFVCYGVGTLVSQFTPLYYREIIDVLNSTGIRADAAEPIFRLIIILASLTAFSIIAHRFGDYYIIRSQTAIMRDLVNYAFAKLEAHSYRFFSESFAGSLVTKTRRFVYGFEAIHDQMVFSFWMTGIQLAASLIILFIVAPPIGFIFLFWCFGYGVITVLFVRKRLPYDLEEAAADSHVISRLADVLTNVLNVKIFSSRAKEITAFEAITQKQRDTRNKALKFDNMQYAIQSIFMSMLQVGGLYVAVRLWLAGTISTGTVVLIETYFVTIFGSMWQLGKSISRFGKAISQSVEMVEIFEKEPDIADPPSPEKVRIAEGAISFSHVDFRHGDHPLLFNNFSLDIKAGERIGLVGHSGAGKSTITKIIMRFADITSGTIMIDGQNIAAITQDDLRNSISYVPQDPILFHRTLRENIAYSRPLATEDEIIEAAKKAHAHEFILGFPEGYDTLVGERGVKLSGGERQRIAIARAFLKQTPVLLLDEATSSLDSVSEKYIQEAFQELMKGRTTIIIAHRLSTIQKMDRILVIEHGAVTEDGSHDELLKKHGAYHKLWSHQAGGFIQD